MQKLAILMVAVVALGMVAGGCGGPFYLHGSASDWYAQQYGDNPWLLGNVISAGIYAWVAGLLWFGDMVILNTYYFWAKDAQPFGDGKGTVFEHKAPTSGKKFK